jgi:beta-glucosidase
MNRNKPLATNPIPINMRPMFVLLITGIIHLTAFAQNEKFPAYLDPELSFEERAEDLVSRMTLEEKVEQMNSFTPAIERLGVPAFHYHNEALHGISEAPGGVLARATSFPQSIAMGSTWNPELMKEVFTAVSDEIRAYDNLGEIDPSMWSPNINMLRDPRWGRNDEAYSEDPYLMSRIAVAFIKGIQGEHPTYLKTIATPKHFVANNSEYNRHDGNSEVEERWLREYYFPAYKACFQEGGAFSSMCAYNRVNGVPACANDWLLTTVLRDEWGFQGYVVSDCGAIVDIFENHNYVETGEEAAALAVKAGCELNCGPVYLDALLNACEQGLISEEEITTAVERIFLGRFKLGMFAEPGEVPYSTIGAEVIESEEHRDLALKAAREAIILLKNKDNTLPLSSSDMKSIAVIGPNANKCRLGSYSGIPTRTISVLEGIKEKVGDQVQVFHEKGCNITFKDKINFSPEEWIDPEEGKDEVTQEQIYATAVEEIEFKMLYDDYLDNTKEPDEVLMARAVELAKKVDQVVLVMGTSRFVSNEEADAEDLNWPGMQGELIKKVFEANPNVVLVTLKGFQIKLNWEEKNLPAIVEAWYTGQEQGHAIADVLFGDYNPGGKLPVTYYRSEDDLPPIGDYDITKGRTYWFFEKEVLYPFGYGLSYTTFEFSNLSVDKKEVMKDEDMDITVTVDVSNTGKVDGDEVVQLYIKDLESSVIQPKKELRGFQRVSLAAGETKTVSIPLSYKDFNYWNENTGDFEIEPGAFEIQVGASSLDIRLRETLTVL